MRAPLALAAAIMLLVGDRMADAQPATPEAPPAALVAPSPAITKPDPGRTVSGITVTPSPKPKACSARDKDCIAIVVAELKQHYPEQLKKFCLQRDMRAIRTQFNQDWLLEDLHSDGPPVPTAFGANAALKVACDQDKK